MTKNTYRFGKDYKPRKRVTARKYSRFKKLHIREIERNKRRFWSAPISPYLVATEFGAALYAALNTPIQPIWTAGNAVIMERNND